MFFKNQHRRCCQKWGRWRIHEVRCLSHNIFLKLLQFHFFCCARLECLLLCWCLYCNLLQFCWLTSFFSVAIWSILVFNACCAVIFASIKYKPKVLLFFVRIELMVLSVAFYGKINWKILQLLLTIFVRFVKMSKQEYLV